MDPVRLDDGIPSSSFSLVMKRWRYWLVGAEARAAYGLPMKPG